MLVIALCCGLIPFIGGVALFLVNIKGRNPFTAGSPALPIALCVAIIPPILLFALSLFSLMTSYDGLCVGPPDYTAPCTYPEYLEYHLFQSAGVFGYILLCFLSTGWGSMAFGLTALYFRKYKPA